jgi:hypothetical protein
VGSDSGRQSKASGDITTTRSRPLFGSIRESRLIHTWPCKWHGFLPDCFLGCSAVLDVASVTFVSPIPFPEACRSWVKQTASASASYKLESPHYHPFNEKDRDAYALQRSCAVYRCLRLCATDIPLPTLTPLSRAHIDMNFID